MVILYTANFRLPAINDAYPAGANVVGSAFWASSSDASHCAGCRLLWFIRWALDPVSYSYAGDGHSRPTVKPVWWADSLIETTSKFAKLCSWDIQFSNSRGGLLGKVVRWYVGLWNLHLEFRNASKYAALLMRLSETGRLIWYSFNGCFKWILLVEIQYESHYCVLKHRFLIILTLKANSRIWTRTPK